MTLPYTLIPFGNAAGNVPLSDLDKNFNNVASYVETAGTVTASAQPNIRSVGTLTELTVVGTVTATGFTGTSLSIAGNITGGNLNTGGIVRSNGVSVNGSIAASTSITAQGNITGQYILGNGYYLTGISSGSSNYSNANVAAYLPTYTGNLTAGNVTITGRYFGSGAGLTNIPGSAITGTVLNASYAATALTVTATSLPNLSTVGTLGTLYVNGGITAGSLAASGNISGAYILGDGSKLTNLPSSGNSNYGNSNVAAYLPTYTGQLNGVTINSGKYYGNGAGLTNVLGSVVTGTVANAAYATQASTVTTAAQPAITSLGTLSSLNVAGNVSTSGKFLGDGSGLAKILNSDQTRTVYVSNSAPSNLQGQPGDIWYQTY